MILVFKKKYILLAAICLAVIISASLIYSQDIFGNISAAISKDNTNWGLGFHKNGEPPTGNATSEYLKQFNSYYIGNTSEKKIYLTFDCGYDNGYIPAILDALKKHNAKAAFFVVGNFIQTSPDMLKKIVDDGHIVGNHTNHHPDMSKISDMESFRKEIDSLNEMYKNVIGSDIQKYYRPPQGKYSEANLKQANELGYKSIFWSLAYVDWYENKQPSKDEAFNKLLPRMHNGAILLLHSTSKTNSEILDELLTKLEAEGYTFGTLDELTT